MVTLNIYKFITNTLNKHENVSFNKNKGKNSEIEIKLCILLKLVFVICNYYLGHMMSLFATKSSHIQAN